MEAVRLANLQAMAEEYLRNVADMEQRIQDLEKEIDSTKGMEQKIKLRRRINTLQVMVCESRQTAFHLQHYYDKPKEEPVYVQPRPQRGRPKKKFSRYGYGAAAPAYVMHGRNADKPTVSGIRSALSRGDATKGNCR